MSASQSEISLDPDGDDFVLRINGDGQTNEVRLTSDHVLTLGQSALSFRQSIMSRRHPDAVYAAPVHSIGVAWNALGEGVLMEMKFLPSGNVLFELPPEQIGVMIEGLERLLQQRPASSLTRQ